MSVGKSAKANIPQIGGGIYLITDVCEILRLPYQKVRYWLNEFWDNGFGINHGGYSFGEKGNKAVNFHTLIEFYTFYKLREQGVSSQKIRKAHNMIAKDLKVQYPFASAVYTDGIDMWYNYLEECIKLDGKKQIALKKVLAPYLKKIEFGEDHIAIKYFPIGKNRNVVVDPHHQFGAPTIVGTNIKTETIIQLKKGGESKESICLLYNLNLHQVNDAILYYRKTA
ncbi:MAG TPA: DUF433 domain-containing protein [Bacteroidia bacterium]|nr:DUF433 domain-containing protein [Bacteroidia bacterium]